MNIRVWPLERSFRRRQKCYHVYEAEDVVLGKTNQLQNDKYGLIPRHEVPRAIRLTESK